MSYARNKRRKEQHKMNNQKPLQAPTNIQLTEKDQKRCSVCGSTVFIPVVALFHVSRFQNPTGHDGMVMKQLGFSCLGCKALNSFQEGEQTENPFNMDVSGTGRVQ
jgi:hypothetical protein